VDWNKIKAEYIAGGTSYRKLAEKHGVSFNTLKDIAVRERWNDLKQQAHNRATTKMVDVVSDKSAKIDDKYFRLVDKLFTKAEEVIDNTPIWQVNSIKEMATALKYLKECKGVKSEADMREQEARIKKLQKEAQEDDNTLTEIKVTFGSNDSEDGDKWAE
jgi:transposase-like protein